MRFDPLRANWFKTYVDTQTLQDEVKLFQLGLETETYEYYKVNYGPQLPSTNKFWPSDEEPDNKYKFTSIALYLNQDVVVTERSSKDLLEYLGDLGGLYDALRVIAGLLVSPIATIALNAGLLQRTFKVISKLSDP